MAVPLTSDVCAYAIVAACRVYRTPPLLAWSSLRGPGRSALCAAASAVQKVTQAQRQVVARVFQVHPVSLARCEREQKPEFLQAAAAAWQAIPTDDDLLASTGTVVAPPPVASEEPAPPAPLQSRVDHTAAIAEALARRRERIAAVPFEVVNVDADKALIGAAEPGGCVWPMGDPRDPDYRSCQAAPLSGRMYCAEHLKKAGMKPVPKTIQTVGRVAEAYVDREAG